MQNLDKIKSLIPGCFGSEDKIFALHPADEQQAKKVVKLCRASGISFESCLGLFQTFLGTKVPEYEKINGQMEEIKKFVLRLWK